MFQIISFKEDGLANLALIKLCEDDSVRLLRSLNPDAEETTYSMWRMASSIRATSTRTNRLA